MLSKDEHKHIDNLAKRRIYRVPPGHAYNPLTKYPDNNPCFCGSEAKAKKCCKPSLRAFINDDTAKLITTKWHGIIWGKVQIPKDQVVAS